MLPQLALIFTAIVTPYEVSFVEPSTSPTDPLFIMNRVVDGIFIIDMCIHFVLSARCPRIATSARQRKALAPPAVDARAVARAGNERATRLRCRLPRRHRVYLRSSSQCTRSRRMTHLSRTCG